MTVEVARRRTRKTTKSASTTPGSLTPSSVSMPAIAIGEIDQTIFACPECARPLALGAHKCPGCGVHLIHGVQVKRVSLFVGIGVAGGLVVALLVSTVMSALAGVAGGGDPAAIVTPTETASAPPATEAPSQPAATTGTGSTSTVPGIVRSALTQAATVDDRLATSASALRAALAASEFDTIVVSQVLRSMSADAVSGLQLAPYIGGWSGGEAVSREMTNFYTSVQGTAAEGFKASIRNTAAYQATATAMVEVLEDLPALDEHVRDAAATAGVDLPPAGTTTP